MLVSEPETLDSGLLVVLVVEWTRCLVHSCLVETFPFRLARTRWILSDRRTVAIVDMGSWSHGNRACAREWPRLIETMTISLAGRAEFRQCPAWTLDPEY